MDNQTNILNSFSVRDELNHKIWVDEDGEYVMKEEVRDSLLKISDDFLEFIDMEMDVVDLTMTGSLANYNWSSYSDIDLHLIVDFESTDDKVLQKYVNAKRIIWNSKHDVEVYGFEVEIYVQDVNEPHFASGVYSIEYEEWVIPPKQEEVDIETDKVLKKSNQWMEIIDDAEIEIEDRPYDESIILLQKVKDKLKRFRSCGLEKGGEYSVENLTFKFLRRNGYIRKLIDLINHIKDDELSLS